MSLLYPDFLWALLLNIIPIFIHLFNLQKHETIYFSDVSLLKSIEEKTKRKSQLKNILLLISRILFVSSVVIAFCFPYKKDQKIDLLKDLNKVGIYIDNSFSMGRSYQNQTLLESAKDDAIKLIDNLPNDPILLKEKLEMLDPNMDVVDTYFDGKEWDVEAMKEDILIVQKELQMS